MSARLRPLLAAFAALALMVSWTTGVWAAACMALPAAVEPADVSSAGVSSTSSHASHDGHAMHGGRGMHHGAHPLPLPKPADHPDSAPEPDGGAPDLPPQCALMLAGGCTGPLAVASPSAIAVDHTPATEYAPPADAPDLLFPVSIFRPPEA